PLQIEKHALKISRSFFSASNSTLPAIAIHGIPTSRHIFATPTGAFPDKDDASNRPSPVIHKSALASRSLNPVASITRPIPGRLRAPTHHKNFRPTSLKRPESTIHRGAPPDSQNDLLRPLVQRPPD